MTWSAAQYTAFEEERTRPVRDLVAALRARPVRAAVDLGCGPGNSTEVLAQRYAGADITGLDSSDDMLTAARRRLPGLRFEQADILDWRAAQPVDVILANASLQWLPDHQALWPRLLAQLAPEGQLAVQMPDNLAEPAHRLAREVAAQGPWAKRLTGDLHPERHTADWYYALLRPLCAQVDVWRTTYFHPLAGAAAVVAWFQGSALRPFLAPLGADERALFLERYQAAIAAAYPALPDGTVLLPFPRLFVVASQRAIL
jgi:trans-aconitate 2-methyltransferase